jgi:hypothetical protein
VDPDAVLVHRAERTRDLDRLHFGQPRKTGKDLAEPRGRDGRLQPPRHLLAGGGGERIETGQGEAGAIRWLVRFEDHSHRDGRRGLPRALG